MVLLFLICAITCAFAGESSAVPADIPKKLCTSAEAAVSKSSLSESCTERASEDCDSSTQLLQSSAMRRFSLGKLQSDRSADLPSMVLFTWIYGDSYFRKPLFKLFLASAAGCGVDVVVLGDAWPPDLPRPKNVRNVSISWDSLVLLLEEKLMDGERLVVMRSLRDFKKINDVKPMTALLLPHLVQGYDWWGWVDNDVLLGDLRSLLLPKLQRSSTDVWSDQVQVPEQSAWSRKFGVCYSHGPFTVLRTSSAASALAAKEHYLDIVRQELRYGFPISFDENGMGINNYTQSYSWMLLSASKSFAISMTKLPEKVNQVNDVTCNPKHAVGPIGADCGYCAFQPQPAAGLELRSVVDYPSIGRTVLQDQTGSNVLYCHMQMGKYLPEFDDTVLAHLNKSRVIYTDRKSVV